MNNFENIQLYLESDDNNIRTLAILSLGKLSFEEFELAQKYIQENEYKFSFEQKNYVRKIKSKFLIKNIKKNVIDERKL